MTRGHDAERLVHDRLRAALPADFRLYPNVSWTAPTRDGGPAVDGEADLVIAHAELGLLVLEVKPGQPTRDGADRWWIGPHQLPRSPVRQAADNKHELVRLLSSLPAWHAGEEPRAGHAVAFPDVDLASLPRGHALLGPDLDRRIVLDAAALATPDATRAWVEAAFAFWCGDGTKGAPLGADGLALLDELLEPHWTLHRLVRGRIDDDQKDLLTATREQRLVLNRTRRMARLDIVGPAGSGKSILAAERARRLAAEGYRTLLVCFNQPLATALHRDLADTPAPGGLVVSTFHRLCETLGERAGALPTKPDRPPPEWFDETLPRALGAAIDALPDERFHAVVVDEGQDFTLDWLLLLEALLVEPDTDVLWIFHDPGQAIHRPDVVGELELERHELYENLRNPGSIARLANRFYRGDEPIEALRDAIAEGADANDENDEAHATQPRIRVVEADPGRPTVDAVRRELHRLTVEEGVKGWDIAVLSGVSASRSEVWAARRFGNVTLWNDAIDDAGHSRGLPPEAIADEPPDVAVVRFETIRRFKGLERAVIVLAELPTERERLDELLYVALTRPTTELVVIAPPALAERLRDGR